MGDHGFAPSSFSFDSLVFGRTIFGDAEFREIRGRISPFGKTTCRGISFSVTDVILGTRCNRCERKCNSDSPRANAEIETPIGSSAGNASPLPPLCLHRFSVFFFFKFNSNSNAAAPFRDKPKESRGISLNDDPSRWPAGGREGDWNTASSEGRE